MFSLPHFHVNSFPLQISFLNGRCIYCFGKARGFTVRLGSSKVRQRLRGFSFANSDDSWHLNGGKAKFSNNQEGVC